MDKKKMTRKGTHIVKRLLAAVCTAALVLGLMPGNLGTMSVQAEDTKTETTTTVSADSITVTEGDTWTLTAQAKADSTNIDGATVVYYSDAECKTKLDNAPTAVGTYYARGEYAGNDSYEASNSAVITVTIKEKTKDYDYSMAELKANGTTRLAAGTKIYLDDKIYVHGQVGGSYEYGIAQRYITYDSSKVQNYENYNTDMGYLIKNAGYYTNTDKGTIITLTNSYTYESSPNKTITGKEWYVYVTYISNTGYIIKIMPTSPTEGYIKEDTHTHTPVHHDEVAATTTSTGTKEYWSCSGCDKIFSDAACTKETTLADLTIIALENSVVIDSGKLIVSAATTVPVIKTATVAATASDVNEMLTKSNNLTQEEITAIKGGKTAKIVLNVTDSTSNITADSKEKIDDKVEELAKTVSGLKVGQYLDIKLKKYIDNVEKADITDLKGNTVTVSMTLSGDLVNTDSTKTRTYYIIRLHDGQADKLDASFDASTNTLSFATGLFSDYAIAYAEMPKPADGGNNGSNGSAAATTTASANTTTTATTDTTVVADGTTDAANTVSSPKTGEGRTVTWLAVILFAGAASIVALKAYRKREI